MSILKISVRAFNSLQRPIKQQSFQKIYCPLNTQFKSIFKSGAKTLEKFKIKDGVPQRFELVYRNPAKLYIDLAQLASVLFLGSITGGFIIFQYYGGELHNDNKDVFGPRNNFQLYLATVSMMITLLVVQYVAVKNPLRIYSNANDFILVRNGILGPVYQKKIAFKSKECSIATPSAFSIWNNQRHTINGKEYLIFDYHFKTSADYMRMVGSK